MERAASFFRREVVFAVGFDTTTLAFTRAGEIFETLRRDFFSAFEMVVKTEGDFFFDKDAVFFELDELAAADFFEPAGLSRVFRELFSSFFLSATTHPLIKMHEANYLILAEDYTPGNASLSIAFSV